METEKKYTCVFDTETTGIPHKTGGIRRDYIGTDINGNQIDTKNHYDYKNMYAFSEARIVSIGCLFYETETVNLVKEFYSVRKPEQFIWNLDAQEFHHITEEQAKQEGKSLLNIVTQLEPYFQKTQLIVAHNIEFDLNILRNELYRINYHTLLGVINQIPTFCTMKQNTKGNERFPKLSVLYQSLTNKQHEKAHNALGDCYATSEIYFTNYKNRL